jgi:hypothetical protein
MAHRVSVELARGPMFCWLTTDHLCRVRACINPDHLESVTQRTNILRGDAPSAVVARTAICKAGHSIDRNQNRGRCRICQAARKREWYERQVAAARAGA